MAWEDFQRGKVCGMTGDLPFDEMSDAVERIRGSYLERFGRNPYIVELLYALKGTVADDPSAYVADATLPTLERPVIRQGRSDMAWEEFQTGAVRGMTGDQPFDEMRAAVKRIRRGYLERWGRNPYFAELLHALEGAVAVDPSAYVADATLPTLERLVEAVGAETTFEHIEPGDYEAGLDGETGDFLVFPCEIPTGRRARDLMVLRGQVIEKGENSVLCRYSILSPAITDGMAKSLIRYCVLQHLLKYNIIDGGLTIRFERTA